jgi:hypothetical protein
VPRGVAEAAAIAEEERRVGAAIGRHFLGLLRELAVGRVGQPVNV